MKRAVAVPWGAPRALDRVPPAPSVVLKAAFLALLAFLVLGDVGQARAQVPGDAEAPREAVEPLTRHWEKPVPLQRLPRGLESLSAQTCGACHAAIYAEWKSSFHAQAWQDPQFQSEWSKDDSLWVCINCHTPLVNQQRYIVEGKIGGDTFRPLKRLNPDFDPQLQQESITCAACHVRDGVVLGPYGDQAASPHAVRQDTLHLSRRLCFGCHNVTEVLNPSLVCVFGTGDEWLAGPYPEIGRDCISCHMAPVERPLGPTGPVRRTRKHTWIGSGIPKVSQGAIHEVEPVAGYIGGLDVRIVGDRQVYHPGEQAYFTVSLRNQQAGHRLPTGDPEYYYTLHLDALAGDRDTLATQVFRIGQEWEWWPEAKKLRDNRLAPLESRPFSIRFAIPDGARRVRLQTRLVTHRVSPENAGFNRLPATYPLSAQVFERVLELVP